MTPTLPAIKNTKWATFTYTSPQIRKITNLLKHTSVKFAYKCTNTILHLSKPTNTANPSSTFKRNGVNKLTCITCNKAYVRQTSRKLKQRYKEHTPIHKKLQPTICICPPYPQQSV